MIGDVSHAEHIYIVCGYTDMRKAIDGLTAIVQQNFGLDVFSGSLFLFCGKRCDRIKALIWEEDGFVLLYKRLEDGKYKWPRDSNEAKLITQKRISLADGRPFDRTKDSYQTCKERKSVLSFQQEK